MATKSSFQPRIPVGQLLETLHNDYHHSSSKQLNYIQHRFQTCRKTKGVITNISSRLICVFFVVAITYKKNLHFHRLRQVTRHFQRLATVIGTAFLLLFEHEILQIWAVLFRQNVNATSVSTRLPNLTSSATIPIQRKLLKLRWKDAIIRSPFANIVKEMDLFCMNFSKYCFQVSNRALFVSYWLISSSTVFWKVFVGSEGFVCVLRNHIIWPTLLKKIVILFERL